jgi:hypothetical protein
MEWLIVLVAAAAILFWTSRSDGIGGMLSRALLRAIPSPTVDSRLLPRALVGGLVLGAITTGLRLADLTALAFGFGLVVGPFVGGALLRTRWWVLVAAVVGALLATGGEIRLFYVTGPVALIAYAGVRWERPKWLRFRDPATDPQ